MNVRYIISLVSTIVIIIVLWQIPPLNLGGFNFNIGHITMNVLMFFCLMGFVRPWISGRVKKFTDLFKEQKKKKGLHDY